MAQVNVKPFSDLWYKQQLPGQLGNVAGMGGGMLGGAMGQWFGGMGQQQVPESQKLAQVAKKEGTEAKVLSWFNDVVDLPPAQRLAQWELNPMKNWPGANAYARYLAQNMPTEEAAQMTATQQLRRTTGGPAALKGLEQFTGGAGAGVFPMGQVPMERRAGLQDPRLRQLGAQFGPVGRRAGMERFAQLPTPTTPGWKPKSWEALLKGEAVEAGEARRAEEWWQERDPQRLLYKARQEAQVEAESMLGEHGYAWTEKRFETLGVPKWVDDLSDNQKFALGLTKTKKGYEMQPVDNVSPETQAMYLQLMSMDMVTVNDLSTDVERAEVRMIAYGGMMAATDPETGKDISRRMRNILETYRQQPLALKSKDEQMNHVVALMGVIGLRQIKALLWLLERPETRETTGAWSRAMGLTPTPTDILKPKTAKQF